MDKRIIGFRKLADKLQKQIDDKRNPGVASQNLTARRARIAASMGKDADKLEEIQGVLYGMADAIENNFLPKSLDGITNKTQIKLILAAVKYRHIFSDFKYDEETKRISTAKLINSEIFEQAKKDIQQYIKGPSEEILKKKKTKEFESELIGTKIPGFFPTPKPIISMMLDLADIELNKTVLEPSAGKGDIVELIKKLYPEINISIIENNHTLVSILEAKGYNPLCEDFLEHKEKYNYIIQNPPFEKFQDIDHIKHAYELLLPGGRLVSIISEAPFFRTDKKAVEFRDWLDEVDSTNQKLESVFKGADSFRQTGIKSRILVVNKPKDPDEFEKETNKEKGKIMEIKINRKDFLKILTKAKYLTSSKTNLAITSTVLLIAENNRLEIQTTDLEVFYQDFCSAKIIQSGYIAVPLKELYNFVQKIKSHEIHMILEDNYWLKISSETIHLNIVCMNSDDFPTMPVMPELNYDKMIKIKTIDLKEMIDKTIIISNNNEKIWKAFKHGIQFKTIKQDDKNFIRMASTNGEQLNLIDKEYPDTLKLELDKGILIPKKDLLKLNKMFLQAAIKTKNKINPFFENENEEYIALGINQNYFIVKKSNATIIIRLLEGEFPDYNDLIFKQNKNIIIIDKKIFLDAIQQIKIMQNKDYNTMLINIENNILKMSLQNPEIGEIEKTIDIEYAGELIEARFSPNQFVNLLNVMKSEKIELNINDNKTPCIITGDQDKYFYGLIMPFK